ncbi:MAG: D-tyrosyl-tRNA(Tyr) deacylase [Tepidisphaera sp.]|nr:D-tyrosyl-tRNA(Tyr) deacylase [Tepidisphaera sp.]
MRTIVQRVSRASVTVDGREVGAIGPGLLLLVGIEIADGEPQAAWTADKAANLRVFSDAGGKMNLSVRDLAQTAASPGLLVVPNFTVAGDASKGRRPSFDSAMRPEAAEPLFARILELIRAAAGPGVVVAGGVFRAHMHVELVNDGPVTLVLQSPA